ncbi:uncharacterized protein LOC125823865 [Solanum verrucosum]|uniref:uncharacterized protein LOC125823865 n=1 Tax=Solanum verrucosum TaxID=315347 RepID=UPI0020D03883|nr:uncharacterized protein LOC125823865 [Solanum verrucosum]
MLTTQYENFTMKEGETIHDMHTRFSSITNELRCLGEPIHSSKQVMKILRVLPKSLARKVDAITEAKDLKVLTMDALIVYQRPGGEKDKRTNLVPKKNARKFAADYVVKKAFAVWGDSSSDLEESECSDDASMLDVKDDKNVFDGLFALMEKLDGEEDEEKESEGSSSQCWFMGSGCSKHMTGKNENFLSLKALQGGGVSFGDGKKGYILGVDRIGKSPEHSIKNVYYVSGLKNSLLSISQICDNGNEVKFLSDKCIVTSLSTKEVILTARRQKNMYVADLNTALGDDLTYLNAQSENANLWHRRLGHVSSSLLNKLFFRDLVRG